MNIITKTSETELAGFSMVYYGSALNEHAPCQGMATGTRGLAHLFEHMGVNQYKHLFAEMESRGIYFNASTYDYKIVFYIHGLVDDILEIAPQICKLILSPLSADKGRFEAERSVVIQEYKDKFINPRTANINNFERKFLKYYGAIGALEDLQNFPYEDAAGHYEHLFHSPDEIIIVAPPGIHESTYSDQIIESIAPFLGDVSVGPEFMTTDQRYDKMLTPTYNPKGYASEPLESSHSLDKTPIIYSWPLIPAEDAPAVVFLAELFGGSLESPIYKEVREKRGLAYFCAAYVNPYGSKAMFMIDTMTSPDNHEEMNIAIREAFDNAEQKIYDRFDQTINYVKKCRRKQEINSYESLMTSTPMYSAYEAVEAGIDRETAVYIFMKYMHPSLAMVTHNSVSQGYLST